MIDHDEMKEQIIAAAREIFARFGYKKTTMDDIAASIYKAKSSIYHYFGSKEDIFKEVIEREAERIHHEITIAVRKKTTPTAKLTTYFSTAQELITETEYYFRVLMDEWYEIFDFTRNMKLRNEEVGIDMLASILQEGNEVGEFAVENPRECAVAITIAHQGFLIPSGLIGSAHKSPASLDIFLNLLLHGLLKR